CASRVGNRLAGRPASRWAAIRSWGRPGHRPWPCPPSCRRPAVQGTSSGRWPSDRRRLAGRERTVRLKLPRHRDGDHGRARMRAPEPRRLGTVRVGREPRAAADLVRLCARLPLAISVAAAHAAAHSGFPLSAQAEELRVRGRDQLDTGDPGTSARTVFSWSYHYLSAPGKRMFRLLGMHPGPDTGVTAAASLALMTTTDAHAALRELGRAHLAEEHAPGRFAVHDLLRAYAAELAAAVDGAGRTRDAELRLLDYYLHTGHAAAMLLTPSSDCGDLAPPAPGAIVAPPATVDEAMAWFAAESRPLIAACARAVEGDLGAHSWQLPWVAAPYLIRQGRWGDFAATQQAAVSAAERV